MTKPTLISKQYQGHTFLFRQDGYFNMTKAAQAFGRRLDDFWRTDGTRRYCFELAMAVGANTGDSRDLSYGLTEAKRGNNGGTWGHPKLAVFFARWLDPKFAVFCDTVIQDILSKKADVVFTPEAEAPKLPQSYLESLQELVKAVAEAERLAQEKAALQADNQRLLPAAEVGQAVGQRSRIGVVEFARKLEGVNTMQVQKDLMVMQYLFKRDGHWAVRHKFKGVLFDEVLAPDGRSKTGAQSNEP
ncbi:hypothetical protein BHQ29_04555 [Pseudomonas sp. LPH1]|nr:KilA-N domain-containing protein [Pseudomonas sp. LPH1]AQZ32615.1 hypothetical protein BHQ29_04555 [Pseudomonas sp. LPH1]